MTCDHHRFNLKKKNSQGHGQLDVCLKYLAQIAANNLYGSCCEFVFRDLKSFRGGIIF